MAKKEIPISIASGEDSEPETESGPVEKAKSAGAESTEEPVVEENVGESESVSGTVESLANVAEAVGDPEPAAGVSENLGGGVRSAEAASLSEPVKVEPQPQVIQEDDSESSEQREIELALALAEAHDQIETLTQDKSNLYDQLLRRQAEFENFRKRQEKERVEFHHRARAELLLDLLPVLDNFDRALSSFDKSDSEAQSLKQGVELIHKQFKDALMKLGLQPVESVGTRFDPNLHEAVASEPSEDHEENAIIEEFQRGYKLGDRLLRPARVKVAAAPEK